MHYVDTSVLVAALLNEAHTEAAQQWLSDQPAGELTISDWVATEFSAALSMKVRLGHLDAKQRGDVLAYFTRILAQSFRVLPVSRQEFRDAARFADQHASGLRAGDALHLAIAASHGLPVVTLDKRLALAGELVGVSARSLI